ncbi:MAG: hypothetical protein JXX28_17295 [Deltaproteobacteria bacterium]|nr:hypothetical protein [Deltaproteobacteria bacterium]
MTLLLALTLLLTPAHAAGEGSVQIILNTPGEAPSTRCEREVCTSLLGLINSANATVDFAIYGMRNQQSILEALSKAQERGVRVRGIVDMDIHEHSIYSDTPLLMKTLGTVHTDFHTDLERSRSLSPQVDTTYRCERPRGFAGPVQCVTLDLGQSCLFTSLASEEPLTFQGDIMHNKFFVIDGVKVWTGSTNISDSGVGGYNANAVAVVDSEKVARWYTQEFEQMYQSGRYHRDKKSYGPRRARLSEDAAVDVWFSPQEEPIRYGVRPLIQMAESRIEVSVFFLTHTGLTQDLIDAHNRGVQVRVIVDATGAKNGYSKHELLRAAGIPVKVESWGGKMHMKAAMVDDRYVIVGSMNWTSAGQSGNDENTLIVEDPGQAARFAGWYEQLWTSIPDRWLQGRPDPESPDSPGACEDGADNDFDGDADRDDKGCGPTPPALSPLPPYRIVPKERGQDLIKGITDEFGDKLYELPGGRSYDWVKVVPAEGGRWFCDEDSARAAGYRRLRDADKR